MTLVKKSIDRCPIIASTIECQVTTIILKFGALCRFHAHHALCCLYSSSPWTQTNSERIIHPIVGALDSVPCSQFITLGHEVAHNPPDSFPMQTQMPNIQKAACGSVPRSRANARHEVAPCTWPYLLNHEDWKTVCILHTTGSQMYFVSKTLDKTMSTTLSQSVRFCS